MKVNVVFLTLHGPEISKYIVTYRIVTYRMINCFLALTFKNRKGIINLFISMTCQVTVYIINYMH